MECREETVISFSAPATSMVLLDGWFDTMRAMKDVTKYNCAEHYITVNMLNSEQKRRMPANRQKINAERRPKMSR